jgi:hypothetical protein
MEGWMERIERTTPIEDLVKGVPGVVSYLIGQGLPCIVCGEPIWGTLGEMAREEGYTEEKIEELAASMNNQLMLRNTR